MDRHRDLEEHFVPVVAINKKMVQDIVRELTPITEELHQLNNKVMRPGVKREIDSRPKQRLMIDFGPQSQELVYGYEEWSRYDIWYSTSQ